MIFLNSSLQEIKILFFEFSPLLRTMDPPFARTGHSSTATIVLRVEETMYAGSLRGKSYLLC